MKHVINLLVIFWFYSLPSLALTGQEIAEQAEQQLGGFGDSVAAIKMVLIDKSNRQIERQMLIKVLEQEAGSKSLVVFKSPKREQGVALLTHSHQSKDDEQWLYLPNIKRVKKIVGNNKSGPFRGSEFAYEDMADQEASNYDYQLLREETLADQAHYVLQRIAKYEGSGYSKTIIWMNKGNYQTSKAVFYDRKGELLKTMITSNYKDFGDYQRPTQVLMSNHKTGKKTLMEALGYKFDVGLKETEFTELRLKGG